MNGNNSNEQDTIEIPEEKKPLQPLRIAHSIDDLTRLAEIKTCNVKHEK